MNCRTSVLEQQPAADATDRQLLERYASARDEAAFALLVRRHGPQVLRIGRRVLGDVHEAEDVFQATFLVLARKAGTVLWQESVAGWLHAVAYRLANHARSAAARRRAQAPATVSLPSDWLDLPDKDTTDPASGLARRELSGVLAEELHRLPEKYRAPVVLCYLEGKTNEEAARQLGWPSGSMSRRLARARSLLRQCLTRRGLVFTLVIASGAFALLREWSSRNPVRSPAVAELMQPFKPVADGGQDMEQALRHLALGEDPGLDAEQLVRLASHTVMVGERLQDYDPSRQSLRWRRLSDTMRQAALDFSHAVAIHDNQTTVAAAHRLTTTCQHCHAVFRD